MKLLKKVLCLNLLFLSLVFVSTSVSVNGYKYEKTNLQDFGFSLTRMEAEKLTLKPNTIATQKKITKTIGLASTKGNTSASSTNKLQVGLANPKSSSPTGTSASSQKIASKPYISIPKIGLNGVSMQYSSQQNLGVLQDKLKYTPIVESRLTQDVCDKGHSYLYGHSEPSNRGEIGYPGSNIFAKLHLLKPGDIIEVANKKGKVCQYKVKKWESVTTNNKDQITRSAFNSLYYPKVKDKPLLTVQTCKLGSSTVRLILRAEMI